MIEAEQGRTGFLVFDVAPGRSAARWKTERRARGLARAGLDEPGRQFPFAEVIGLLAGLRQTAPDCPPSA